MAKTRYQQNIDLMTDKAVHIGEVKADEEVFIVYGHDCFPSILHARISHHNGGPANPHVWGFSEWKRSCGFRTVGVGWETFASRYGKGAPIYIFRDHRDALNYIAVLMNQVPIFEENRDAA